MDLLLSPKFNCFIGDNAAGKTNILDSVYYLSMCKSGFGASDRQLVMLGKEFYVLDATYRADSGSIDKVNWIYRPPGVKKMKKKEKIKDKGEQESVEGRSLNH